MTSTLSRHLGTPAPIPAVPPACPALSATPAVGPVRKPCWDPLRASWEVLGRGQRDDPWGGRPVQWLGTGARWLQDFQGKRELEQSHRSSLAPPNQGHIGAGRSLRAWEGGYSSAFGCLSPAQGQQVPPGWQDWTGLTWGGGQVGDAEEGAGGCRISPCLGQCCPAGALPSPLLWGGGT